MAIQIHTEANPVPLSANPDTDGITWAGVSAGAGTVAIAAGGWATTKNPSANTAASAPLPVPVYVKPSGSDASYMLVGTVVPDGGQLYMCGLWCAYVTEE